MIAVLDAVLAMPLQGFTDSLKSLPDNRQQIVKTLNFNNKMTC